MFKSTNIYKFILTIFFSIFSHHSFSNENCFVQFSNTNICDYAKKVQKEMAPNLPMQLSQNLVVRSITAVGPELGANAILKYTEQYLNNQLSKVGRTRESVDNQMRLMTINMVCTSPELEAFLGLGGKILYSYNFVDGKKYLNIPISIKDC